MDVSTSPLVSRSTSTWPLATALLGALALLLALVFWPQTKPLIPGVADPPTVQPLGAVLDIGFIAGFGAHTQVRTAAKTVLLYGAVEIDRYHDTAGR